METINAKMKLAFCGLDCAQCGAYIATQNNDQALKEKTLENWRKIYNSPDMTLDSVTCDGCTSTGRLGGYCGACPIRACGMEKGLANCGHCADFSCEKLEAFIVNIPNGRENLEAERGQK